LIQKKEPKKKSPKGIPAGKAGERMAKNFFATLKRIKSTSIPSNAGDDYSFLYALLRNFLNAILSQAKNNCLGKIDKASEY
jgi:hypothetical protein